MGRKIFKRLCIAAVVILILLMLLTIFIWMMANVGVVLLYILSMGNGDIPPEGIPLGKLMENFVGSPLFYAYVADGALLAVSVTGLIATKRKSNDDQGVSHGKS